MSPVHEGPKGDPGWLDRAHGTKLISVACCAVKVGDTWELGIVCHYLTAEGRGWALRSPGYTVWPEEIGADNNPEDVVEALGHVLVDVGKAHGATVH